MKVVIFAGGSGRRLWPISRQKSPKQFEPIIGSKSTLRLAVERVLDTYGAENIFISTNEQYRPLVWEQLPELPRQNVIGEPMRRDLAAAVGLAMLHISHAQSEAEQHEPVAILWGDNYMNHVDNFLQLMSVAEKLVWQQKANILFIGETPRFANENLGWLGLGEEKGSLDGLPYFGFTELIYRPPLRQCRRMYAQKTHVWNTGYFVTTTAFIRELYEKHQPNLWRKLSKIEVAIGEPDYETVLNQVYPELDEISFDDAILQYVDPEKALVLHTRMGWSDPGTLYSLKEAIDGDPTSNVTKGLVVADESEDCLLYNYEDDKLVVAAGLVGMIVVNTDDALLVVPKNRIPLVKQIVNSMEGTELEKYS